MGGDRKETDEKEKIFEMVDRGGISGFHCRSGNICIIRSIRRHRRRETSPRKTEHPTSASDITWNGKTYSYNEHLSNFLFLGIDTKKRQRQKQVRQTPGRRTRCIFCHGIGWKEILQ